MSLISRQDQGNAKNGIHQTTLSETMDARGWSSRRNKAGQDVADIQMGTEGRLLTSGTSSGERRHEACSNEMQR